MTDEFTSGSAFTTPSDVEPPLPDGCGPALPFCAKCGYDLTGIPSVTRCPECGQSYEAGAVGARLASYRKRNLFAFVPFHVFVVVQFLIYISQKSWSLYGVRLVLPALFVGATIVSVILWWRFERTPRGQSMIVFGRDGYRLPKSDAFSPWHGLEHAEVTPMPRLFRSSTPYCSITVYSSGLRQRLPLNESPERTSWLNDVIEARITNAHRRTAINSMRPSASSPKPNKSPQHIDPPAAASP